MLFFLERKPEKFISENNMVKVQMVEPLCDAFSIFCLCFGSFANQLRQELLALNSITVERKIFFLDWVKNFEIICTIALCLGLRLTFR